MIRTSAMAIGIGFALLVSAAGAQTAGNPPTDFELRGYKFTAELAPLTIEGTWTYDQDATFEIQRLFLRQFEDVDAQPDEAWDQLSLTVERDGTSYSFVDVDAWNLSSNPPCYRIRVVDGSQTYGWATECIPHPPSSGGGDEPSPTPGAPVAGDSAGQRGEPAVPLAVALGVTLALAGGAGALAIRRR